MASKKNAGNLLILIMILVLTYIVFGVFIVGSSGSPSSYVEEYQGVYSSDDSSQLKGFNLIKDNWRRVREEKKLMQFQVDFKKY